MKSKVDALLQEHKKLIESEAKRYATNIPLITVQIEANKLARQAAESYSPAMGKFSTHLVNSLKKLSRMSTQYGGTVRLPENTQFGLNKLNRAEKEIESEFGRPPTLEELADRTGFGVKGVNNLLKNRKTTISFNNLLATPTFVDSSNDEWLQFVYHDLNPRDKLIFEHKTGFGGKPTLENDALAKKLGLTTPQLNARVNIISSMINKGWR
jgi:DNA-directed RNA polymerase sigma subunit (sigma70/sigma32)